MNFIDKIERKLGKHAIPNLYMYFIVANVLGYLFSLLGLTDYLYFSVALILKGQVWRLISWIFIWDGGNVIMSFIFLFCVFGWGRYLEACYGSFRMNLYFIGGVLLNAIGGVILYFVGIPIYLTSYYILLGMILLLSLSNPDGVANIYFVFPLKMKWLSIIELALLAYYVIFYFKQGIVVGLVMTPTIILSVLNIFLFFWIVKQKVSHKHKRRQKEFYSKMNESRTQSAYRVHKCSTCGRTSLEDNTLVFRYCSRCNGAHEYCQEHLFTHRHKE